MNEIERTILNALDWAYEKALEGAPGFDSALELAEDYRRRDGTLYDQVNALISWQDAKAATTGFVTGLPGIIALPVTLPANLTVVCLVQLRMIAAIAILAGHDIRDDRVKTLAYACLAGNSAKRILRELGVNVANKLAHRVIRNISGETLKAINQAVGFRLVTKFGTKGVVNLGRAVPLAGAVVSAIIEAMATHAVGSVARDIFITTQSNTKAL